MLFLRTGVLSEQSVLHAFLIDVVVLNRDRTDLNREIKLKEKYKIF
jgi:hypothetical protein